MEESIAVARCREFNPFITAGTLSSIRNNWWKGPLQLLKGRSLNTFDRTVGGSCSGSPTIISLVMPSCNGIKQSISVACDAWKNIIISLVMPSCNGIKQSISVACDAWKNIIISLVMPNCNGIKQSISVACEAWKHIIISLVMPNCNGIK